MNSRLHHVCALCLAAAACGSEDRSGLDLLQDTSGAEIVGNEAPVWAEGTGWRLADQPTLSIGRENDAPEFRFNRIRNILSLPGGLILIANGGPPPEIRIFDLAGTPVAVFGGAGEGPGEFRSLFGAWLTPGDTILTLDTGLRRITLFDPIGTVLRTESIGRLLEGGFVALDRFDDGSWLLAENVPTTIEQNGQARIRRYLGRSRIGDARTDTLVGFGEAIKVREGLEWETPLFYPGVGTYIAHGDRLYAGYPHGFNIDVFRSDGTHLQRISRQTGNRAVTNEVFDRLAEARLAASTIEMRPTVERQLATRDRPDELPAFGSTFVVDVGNHLWVQDFVVAGDDPVHWSIFDSTGRFLGRVALPAAFRPMEIGTDRVLGVWRDSFDVETVRVYALDRSTS